MKYSFAVLALATGALAGKYPSYPVAPAYNGTVVYTTEVVTAYTTYCPEEATVTWGGETYYASASQTLTFPEYTTTYPVVTPTPSTVLYTSCPPTTAEYATESYPAESYATTATYSNPLTVSYSTYAPTGGYPVGTGAAYPTYTNTPFTGAASANKVGALIGAVVGVVAVAL